MNAEFVIGVSSTQICLVYSAINITKETVDCARVESFMLFRKIKRGYVVSVKDRECNDALHEFKEEMCYGGFKERNGGTVYPESSAGLFVLITT